MAKNLLSEQEISEFREMFDLLDTNRSGRIACAEMRKLMETLRLRPTEEELEQTFREANSDPTRGVDFDEFIAMMSKRVRSDYTPEQLRGAFKLFETEDMSPGFVSTEVLEHALVSYGTEKLSHEEAQRLLATVDPNGTGKVNYNEFVSMVTEMQRLAFKTQRGEAWGKRASRIIIGHGLLGNSSNWSTVARLLAQHSLLREKIHEIDLLDMRNHGDSPHVPLHSNAALASDLEFFAQQRQIAVSTKTDADEGVVLVGHSMSGLALMGMLLRRANEAALLLPDPAELQARCERGDYYGWRDVQGYGREMRAVNEAMGFPTTQPLRDVLFASPPNASATLPGRRRKGPRVKAAIVVDVTPMTSVSSSSRLSQSVVQTLESMAQLDVSRLRNVSEGARELEALGAKEKSMRDFVLTNLRFDPTTKEGSWRCNLPTLVSEYRKLDLDLRQWFIAKHKADQQGQQQQQGNGSMVAPMRCDVPTLFVFGEKSPYNCSADDALIELFFSDFTRAEVAGAGHFVHYEKMKDFIDVVAPFLAKHL